MRHLKSGRRLGVTPSHRKAMMRNLVTSLFEHGRIKTTLARAKEIRKDAEKLITLSKRGDLHSIRLAMEKIRSKDVCHKLFNEIAPLNQAVQGGYTRIYKLENRKGDNAKMSVIEVIFYPDAAGSEEEQTKSTEDSTKLLDTVTEEVKSEVETKEEVQASEKSKQDTLEEKSKQDTLTEKSKQDTPDEQR